MKRFIPILVLLLLSTLSFSSEGLRHPVLRETVNTLYDELGLAEKGLGRDVYNEAIAGFSELVSDGQATSVLSIADFSKSSNTRRLFVIDTEKRELLFHTYVAHGRNSGDEYASTFSNKPNSNMSSLGFYLTGDTYTGKHGLSLRLMGMEKGINDLSYERAIVIHGADYVSEDFIAKYGHLGRSLGCPAVPVELSAEIINSLKGGSCLFLYHPDKKYHTDSSLLASLSGK